MALAAALDNVGVTEDEKKLDLNMRDEKSVMLAPKLEVIESQSTGMLLPSSSSSESGARVHAGPGVSLEMLKELLLVIEAVFVDLTSTTLQPIAVASKIVQQVDDVDVVVEAVVDTVDETFDGTVVTEMPEDA